MSSERYSRQSDIVPRQRILDSRVTVIGVGAIGRQVASQLTAIGVPQLQIIDHDIVEESNIASQGYYQDDLMRFKVHATADICHQINPKLELYTPNERFKRSMKIGNCVFVCVDKIETRKHIWDVVKDNVNFFCDGRMSAEVLRVITACDDKSRAYYPQTLFAASEAHVGPCTAKTTIYCANIAAGFMLAQFTKYLRLLPVDPDIQVNLLASEISVNDGTDAQKDNDDRPWVDHPSPTSLADIENHFADGGSLAVEIPDCTEPECGGNCCTTYSDMDEFRDICGDVFLDYDSDDFSRMHLIPKF